jgi:hypothetical protein
MILSTELSEHTDEIVAITMKIDEMFANKESSIAMSVLATLLMNYAAREKECGDRVNSFCHAISEQVHFMYNTEKTNVN